MAAPEPEITRLQLGLLQTNCYLVVCPETRAALVIDPADSPQRIVSAAERQNARIEQILLTHGHLDHSAGLAGLREATGARVLVHKLELVMLGEYLRVFGLSGSQVLPVVPDLELNGGEQFDICRLRAEVIHTPGHTLGGISVLIGKHLFSGDTLFAQGVGRTDLPGGSWNALRESIQRLFELPDDTVVYPGHGASTTIGEEKRDNPYV